MESNLLSDQIRRSSTIIVAAMHGYQSAATLHAVQAPSAASSMLPLDTQKFLRGLMKKQVHKLETTNVTSFSSIPSKSNGKGGTTYYNANNNGNNNNTNKPNNSNNSKKGKGSNDYQAKRQKLQPPASSSAPQATAKPQNP